MHPVPDSQVDVAPKIVRRRTRVPGRAKAQEAKSETMRAQILDAAIDCLASRPYSEVSAALIAQAAGVSRGGMQYHFPTWLALLSATVAHLHTRRLALFKADLSVQPESGDLFDHVVDTHWRHLNEREFRAYQEIVLAARSEPELKALLGTLYGDFLHEWHEIARRMFGWAYTDPAVARAGNVAHYVLDGMAYGQIANQLDPDEVQQLLDFAKRILREALAANGDPAER